MDRSNLFDNVERPTLKLVGEDGNSFFIIGRARKTAQRAGWTQEMIKEYTDVAMSGDYNKVLLATQIYFDVE